MSLLKTTNIEDLVHNRTMDVKKTAKSTLAHDKDDLVSDKDREDTDSHSQDAIDKAVSSGRVHQESLTEALGYSESELQTLLNNDLQ